VRRRALEREVLSFVDASSQNLAQWICILSYASLTGKLAFSSAGARVAQLEPLIADLDITILRENTEGFPPLDVARADGGIMENRVYWIPINPTA